LAAHREEHLTDYDPAQFLIVYAVAAALLVAGKG